MDLISKIAKDTKIRGCLRFFETTLQEFLDLAVQIQQIPAPTFDEVQRAGFLEEQFRQLPLEDVHQDEIGNVLGRIPGRNPSRSLVISAHIDTVFPFETDLKIEKHKDPETGRLRILGPGIADNALGVAGLIMLASAINQFHLEFHDDVWLAANVGEEGLGDLRGMRLLTDRFKDEATYLIIEGGSFGNIFYQGIGVRRFKIEIETPGGHSWGDFGEPSAIHILSQVIADITSLRVQEVPKTTFNIGKIEGGTSINTIASSATCLLDLRSADATQLASLSNEVEKIIRQRSNGSTIKAQMTEIGSRPAGMIERNSPIIKWAEAALEHVGCQNISLMSGSTDANIPIFHGYPAVCIGIANSGNTHRVDEYVEPEMAPKGLGQLLLLTAAAAGYIGNINEL